MNFSLVKDSSRFAWVQLKANPGAWFILSLKSFFMMLVMVGGLITFMLCALFLYGFMSISPGFILYDPSLIVQLLALVFFITGIYQALIQIVSYGNVTIANSLDASYQKPLRKFNNRVQVRSLLFIGFFQAMVVGIGILILIIPGIYFAVRFSLSRLIILDEQCGAIEAMQKSWALTENNLGIVLPVCVLAFILLVFPVTRLINVFFPLIDLMMSHAYVSLKQK